MNKQFTFSFDFSYEGDFITAIIKFLKPFNVSISGLDPEGPGGGHPEVYVSGEYDDVLKVAIEYHGDEDMEWIKELIEEV